MPDDVRIGLALSGGGSRAIAFHLGCLRALHDRGILERVHVLSTVSGGSVIGALYAYSDESFDAFDARVQRLLRRGLVWGIVSQTFLSPEALKIAAAIVTGGIIAILGLILRSVVLLLGAIKIGGARIEAAAAYLTALIPRFASRSTAFERHLRNRYFGDRALNDVGRAKLHVVVNATELRTETAFRYGSQESGTWRHGCLTTTPRVSKAVAASAAFPALLPCFDEVSTFRKKGQEQKHRVLVTDGGVYDNLGLSCMLPDRSSDFSTNAHAVDFIIACDAGHGLPDGGRLPYFWGSRMLATISTIHRRTHTQAYGLLHELSASGRIAGFILPYLGQIDDRLPYRPPDLVPRSATFGYPTDFNPMSETDIEQLSQRGEQLTSLLLDAYAPRI